MNTQERCEERKIPAASLQGLSAQPSADELLVIAGEKDNLMPAALNKANFKRYEASAPSITDFKEFPGRTHFSVIGGKGWEEVADFAINWAEKHIGTVNMDRRHEPAQVVATG